MIIYGLVDPRSGFLRYVGKSANPALRLHGHVADSKKYRHRCANWVRSLLKLGLKPEMIELEAVEGDGCDAERFWIANFRAAGAILLNATDGGDGVQFTAEVRARMADKASSRSTETRERLSQAKRGKLASPETKAKMSASHKGLITPEWRAKMNAGIARHHVR